MFSYFPGPIISTHTRNLKGRGGAVVSGHQRNMCAAKKGVGLKQTRVALLARERGRQSASRCVRRRREPAAASSPGGHIFQAHIGGTGSLMNQTRSAAQPNRSFKPQNLHQIIKHNPTKKIQLAPSRAGTRTPPARSQAPRRRRNPATHHRCNSHQL
jgi:hypothetical protein